MKIRLFPFAAVAVVMASCSNEDVMELNPDPAGDALSFSIAVSHSRATETKIDNLGNFCVVAKGIHPHGGVYDNYLIGGKDGGLLARKPPSMVNTYGLLIKTYIGRLLLPVLFFGLITALRTPPQLKFCPVVQNSNLMRMIKTRLKLLVSLRPELI